MPLFCAGPGALNRLGKARETKSAAILARNVSASMNVVGTVVSPARTTEAGRKPTPVTVISNSGLPSATLYGAIALIAGSATLVVLRLVLAAPYFRSAVLEIPPSGGELNTDTFRV